MLLANDVLEALGWHAGSVEVAAEISEELLQAADQYMLEPLKRLCEAAIAAGLSTDNLASIYDLSENFNAPQLGRHCMLYALEHYEELVRPELLCTSSHLLSTSTMCIYMYSVGPPAKLWKAA